MPPSKTAKKPAVDTPDEKPAAKRRRPMDKKAEVKKSNEKKADTNKPDEPEDTEMQNAAPLDDKEDEVETADLEVDENESEDQSHATARIIGLWQFSEGASTTDPMSPSFDPQCEAAKLTDKQVQEFGLIAAVLETPKGCNMGVPLTNMFRRVIQCSSTDPVGDLDSILKILLNRCSPFSHKVVSQAIAETFGLKFDRKGAIGEGDLPDIALAGRKKQKSLFQCNRLTNAVVSCLLNVGGDRVDRKDLQPFIKVLGQSKEQHRETSHLVQLLLGRTLVSQRLVLQSLAHAFVWTRVGSNPSTRVFANQDEMAMMMVRMEDAIRCAYSSTGCNTGILAQGLLGGCGPDALTHACCPTPMVPVLTMQPEMAESIPAALGKLDGQYAADWLYAGQKVHVHVSDSGGKVMVYNTSMVPWEQERVDEISSSVQTSLKNVSDCIFEAIVPKKPRVKKLTKDEKAAQEAGELQAPEEPKLCIVIYDMIALNGEPLVSRSLRGRRAELSACVVENEQVKLAKSSEVAHEESEEVIKKLLNEAIAPDAKADHRGFGLVLKQLDGDSRYRSGCRTSQWQIIQKPVLTGADADKALLACLTEEESKHLADTDAFHFAVISARRTQTPEGVADIRNIQEKFTAAGVQPVWYVDAKSLEDYKKLGLNAIDGGKLIPARNKALDDAQEANRVCVQCSDDIGKWEYFNGAENGVNGDQSEANANWRMSDRYLCSPVAAAQFILAKMRVTNAKLGGVFPLANAGRSFMGPAFTYAQFILGDFFVSDVSDVRFDKTMTLKEDYDYTSSHLHKYGAVVRCQRMLISAKHETNHGGACSTRDPDGKEEQKNIKILKEKWPGVFMDNGRRANQVIMRWKFLKKAEMKDPEAKITW